MFKTIGKIGAVLYCAAIVVVSVLFTIRDANRNLKNDVVIEAGSKIRIQDFFEKCPDDARFVTDVSGINTNEPAVYQLKVFYDETFEKDVILRIEDHTAPKGVALPKSVYTTWNAPDAADCVGYLYDLSGIAKVEFAKEPEFKEGGDYSVPVIVTDVYGNEAEIDVPFTVIDDHTAPVITGVKNIEFFLDDEEPDFFEGIEVSDDFDDDPALLIDDSDVDYEKAGTYQIKYEAIDKAGNSSFKLAELTLKKPANNSAPKKKVVVNDDDDDYAGGSSNGASSGSTGSSSSAGTSTKAKAQKLAKKVMSGLWGSNDVATARNIFNWVHSHIYYTRVPGRPSYAKAAYRGFSKRSGDCYVYYACCKMLLDIAGIPNMMVKRYPVTGNNHYWNLVKLNGQWYHCDATVFKHRRTIYFMCTDKQINDKYHHFNGKLYPARAGGSTDYKPTDTPTPIPTNTNTPVPENPNTSGPTPTPVPETSQNPTPSVITTTTDNPTPTPVTTNTPTGTDDPTPTPVTTTKPTGTDEPTNTPTTPPADTPANTPTNTPKPATNTPTNTPKPKPTEAEAPSDTPAGE